MGSRKGTRSEAVRKGNRRRRNPAARDIRGAKKAEAIRLRLEGNSYRAIAGKLELSLGAVHAICTEALDELHAEGRADAKRMLDEQLELMDRGQMLIVRMLFNEKLIVLDERPDGSVMRLADFEVVSRLTMALIKYSERIAKLAGLDKLGYAETRSAEMLNEEALSRIVCESARRRGADGGPSCMD